MFGLANLSTFRDHDESVHGVVLSVYSEIVYWVSYR